MTARSRPRVWFVAAALLLVAICLVGGVLLPFVACTAIANLLAVPTAAVIGVLSCFADARYRDNRYFRGDPTWPNSPST